MTCYNVLTVPLFLATLLCVAFGRERVASESSSSVEDLGQNYYGYHDMEDIHNDPEKRDESNKENAKGPGGDGSKKLLNRKEPFQELDDPYTYDGSHSKEEELSDDSQENDEQGTTESQETIQSKIKEDEPPTNRRPPRNRKNNGFSKNSENDYDSFVQSNVKNSKRITTNNINNRRKFNGRGNNKSSFKKTKNSNEKKKPTKKFRSHHRHHHRHYRSKVANINKIHKNKEKIKKRLEELMKDYNDNGYNENVATDDSAHFDSDNEQESNYTVDNKLNQAHRSSDEDLTEEIVVTLPTISDSGYSEKITKKKVGRTSLLEKPKDEYFNEDQRKKGYIEKKILSSSTSEGEVNPIKSSNRPFNKDEETRFRKYHNSNTRGNKNLDRRSDYSAEDSLIQESNEENTRNFEQESDTKDSYEPESREEDNDKLRQGYENEENKNPEPKSREEDKDKFIQRSEEDNKKTLRQMPEEEYRQESQEEGKDYIRQSSVQDEDQSLIKEPNEQLEELKERENSKLNMYDHKSPSNQKYEGNFRESSDPNDKSRIQNGSKHNKKLYQSKLNRKSHHQGYGSINDRSDNYYKDEYNNNDHQESDKILKSNYGRESENEPNYKKKDDYSENEPNYKKKDDYSDNVQRGDYLDNEKRGDYFDNKHYQHDSDNKHYQQDSDKKHYQHESDYEDDYKTHGTKLRQKSYPNEDRYDKKGHNQENGFNKHHSSYDKNYKHDPVLEEDENYSQKGDLSENKHSNRINDYSPNNRSYNDRDKHYKREYDLDDDGEAYHSSHRHNKEGPVMGYNRKDRQSDYLSNKRYRQDPDYVDEDNDHSKKIHPSSYHDESNYKGKDYDENEEKYRTHRRHYKQGVHLENERLDSRLRNIKQKSSIPKVEGNSLRSYHDKNKYRNNQNSLDSRHWYKGISHRDHHHHKIKYGLKNKNSHPDKISHELRQRSQRLEDTHYKNNNEQSFRGSYLNNNEQKSGLVNDRLIQKVSSRHKVVKKSQDSKGSKRLRQVSSLVDDHNSNNGKKYRNGLYKVKKKYYDQNSGFNGAKLSQIPDLQSDKYYRENTNSGQVKNENSRLVVGEEAQKPYRQISQLPQSLDNKEGRRVLRQKEEESGKGNPTQNGIPLYSINQPIQPENKGSQQSNNNPVNESKDLKSARLSYIQPPQSVNVAENESLRAGAQNVSASLQQEVNPIVQGSKLEVERKFLNGPIINEGQGLKQRSGIAAGHQSPSVEDSVKQQGVRHQFNVVHNSHLHQGPEAVVGDSQPIYLSNDIPTNPGNNTENFQRVSSNIIEPNNNNIVA